MKHLSKLPFVRTAGLLLAATTLLFWSQAAEQPQPGSSPPKLAELATEVAALRAEVERLKTLVPDQAHAMEDVGYHFANLWFAAEQKNWPLADFYLAETRSHLKWAVRIRPVRQTKAGDLDLNGILTAVDNTFLTAVKESIDQQDGQKFAVAYRQTIEGCYSCHTASEKPFIRPQVPTALAEHIINLDPRAKWPE
ncbi:MAG: hypothetical protein HYY24_28335 [Verrucomicrobia bacterium]|nr:hypothetical protein [Verrucomicrobiota bacterium]